MGSVTDLPLPEAAAQQLSAALVDHIRKEISAAGGQIPFSRYMELCLYTPGMGYYSAGQRKFGRGGDFVTAPEISPLFGRCMARSCAAVLEQTGGNIVEFGAGSGRLAVDLLGELAALDCLPDHYLILERSADLIQRQQSLIHSEIPQLEDRVRWIDTLPAPGFCGVMVANEVVDAMACERFCWDGEQLQQLFVAQGDRSFVPRWQAMVTGDQSSAIQDYVQTYDLSPGYESEFNPAIDPWIRSVASCIDAGMLLVIDYGYTRREYLHPQRTRGTLQCHYRQRAHNDPFFLPGLQDITAHVDFTAIAESAVDANLTVAGYTTQAHFLLDCGLDALLADAGPSEGVDYMRQVQQAKTLILPGEMGERFQCIGLVRGIDMDIPGFRMQDMRGRL